MSNTRTEPWPVGTRLVVIYAHCDPHLVGRTFTARTPVHPPTGEATRIPKPLNWIEAEDMSLRWHVPTGYYSTNWMVPLEDPDEHREVEEDKELVYGE